MKGEEFMFPFGTRQNEGDLAQLDEGKELMFPFGTRQNEGKT